MKFFKKKNLNISIVNLGLGKERTLIYNNFCFIIPNVKRILLIYKFLYYGSNLIILIVKRKFRIQTFGTVTEKNKNIFSQWKPEETFPFFFLYKLKKKITFHSPLYFIIR